MDCRLYSFDREGQTVSKTDGTGTTNYNWDARGRLTQVTPPNGQSVSYGYDALGRRASRSASNSTTSFLYDGSDVVVDRTGSNALEYLHGAGTDEHLRQGAPGNGLYFLQDHLGSTAALTNAMGGVQERAVYEPFGNNSGSAVTRYGYTGRERDNATGLLHYREREYDAEQGRFLTEDPAGLQGGTNLYTYANNSPINFNDPFGLSAWTFVQGLGSGVLAGAGGYIAATIIMAALTAAGISTGGAVFAVIGAIVAAVGLYSLLAEVDAITKMWFACPDERDYRIGRLIGEAVGAMLGAKAVEMGRAGLAKLLKGGGGNAPVQPCLTCFVAGTQVALADGDGKQIEAIQLDDVVLSADQIAALDAKATTQPQNTVGKVSEVFSRLAPAVLDISVGAQEKLTVTPEHEFWVIGEGWKEARELWRGAKLLTKNGQTLTVENIGKRTGAFRVYNFGVAGTHTYFVGKTGVLVHNACKQQPHPDAVGEHTTFRRDPQTGKINHYETYRPQTNPRNPSPWEATGRFDRGGDPHFNKVTQQYVPNPHVHDPVAPGGVRPALPNEIPK